MKYSCLAAAVLSIPKRGVRPPINGYSFCPNQAQALVSLLWFGLLCLLALLACFIGCLVSFANYIVCLSLVNLAGQLASQSLGSRDSYEDPVASLRNPLSKQKPILSLKSSTLQRDLQAERNMVQCDFGGGEKMGPPGFHFFTHHLTSCRARSSAQMLPASTKCFSPCQETSPSHLSSPTAWLLQCFWGPESEHLRVNLGHEKDIDRKVQIVKSLSFPTTSFSQGSHGVWMNRCHARESPSARNLNLTLTPSSRSPIVEHLPRQGRSKMSSFGYDVAVNKPKNTSVKKNPPQKVLL